MTNKSFDSLEYYLCRAATAGTEVVAVTGADADAEDTVVAGSPSPAVPMWKGCSNTWSILVTFFGPKPGSRVSCTTSDCEFSMKLCPRNVRSEERGGKGGGRRGQVDIRQMTHGACLVHVQDARECRA